MTSQNKTFLKNVQNMFNKVIKAISYTNNTLKPSARKKSGACLTCHGSGVGPSSHSRTIQKLRMPKSAGGLTGGVKRRIPTKRKAKTSTQSRKNPWLLHLEKYKRAHPGLTFGEAMRKAKASYHK